MAGRNIPLATGEFYHVFNRGIALQPVFLNKRDYEQAILGLSYYRFAKPPFKLSRFKSLSLEKKNNVLDSLNKNGDSLVKIISFVLMPNHFHLLVQQTEDKGISIFLSKFTNSYTKYFNIKNKRVGDLFQGVFKAVRVETEEQLLHLSRYIHLNPLVSFVVKEKDFLSYSWSSLPHFLQEKSSLCWTEPILSNFSSPNEYKNFILDHADYAKELEKIKHLALEG